MAEKGKSEIRGDQIMDRYNSEHYRDPTPHKALMPTKAERVDALGRLGTVYRHAEKLARDYGFVLTGSITGIDDKTGMEFEYSR